jgi:hypothetical protein
MRISETILGFTYLGCYIDPLQPVRALPNGTIQGSGVTLDKCLSTCKTRGFPFAGAQYTGECWCGEKLDGNITRSVDDKECFGHCRGNVSQICGAPARLSVYKAKSGASKIGVMGMWVGVVGGLFGGVVLTWL